MSILLGLSNADRGHLEDFNRLLDLIHDRTLGVAKGYHVGVFITGRAGTGKTHTVRRTLEDYGVNFRWLSNRVSPMGLWRTLQNFPDHVIVLDDLPSMFKSDEPLQVLLAALGGHAGQPRTITYTTLDRDLSFEFCGGLVCITNRPLARNPVADALASRVQPYEHEVTDEMMAAFMRAEALKGYKALTPEACMAVVEFIVAECKESDYRLDLRYLRKGWEDRRLFDDGRSRCAWEDLIRSSLKRLFVHQMREPTRTRSEKTDANARLAVDLFRRFPDDRLARESEWAKVTNLSESSLYDYRQRARQLGHG